MSSPQESSIREIQESHEHSIGQDGRCKCHHEKKECTWTPCYKKVIRTEVKPVVKCEPYEEEVTKFRKEKYKVKVPKQIMVEEIRERDVPYTVKVCHIREVEEMKEFPYEELEVEWKQVCKPCRCHPCKKEPSCHHSHKKSCSSSSEWSGWH